MMKADTCPLCGNTFVQGYTPRHYSSTSVLKKGLKLAFSQLIGVPIVGGVAVDCIDSLFTDAAQRGLQRYVCPHCFLSWVVSSESIDLKYIVKDCFSVVFYRNAFVIGDINNDYFLMGKVDNQCIVNAKVFKGINGRNESSANISFRVFKTGSYLGEFNNGKANGIGLLCRKDGTLLYGNWIDGSIQGVCYQYAYLSDELKVSYFKNGVSII